MDESTEAEWKGAEKNFLHELDDLYAYTPEVDVAMFPVDHRLGCLLYTSLRAAPKKRLGLCRAFASTPPDNTLPEAGETVLYARCLLYTSHR